MITGASSGIGRELAQQFADHGFDLVLNTEDDRLDAAATELRNTGVDVRAVRADLRTAQGVEQLREANRRGKVSVTLCGLRPALDSGISPIRPPRLFATGVPRSSQSGP